MPVVNVGSNRFENVAIPLILDDRYFLLENDGTWTVFVIANAAPNVEILHNQPQENGMSTVETNVTGILTVSDSTSGQFRYKLRPGSTSSSIFGTIDGQETEIRVSDRDVRIGTNVFSNNRVTGLTVGIQVRNGKIGLGASLPPEFLLLVER